MKFSIKQAGILFAVLAVVVLAVVGCFSFNAIAVSENNLASNTFADSTMADSNIQNEQTADNSDLLEYKPKEVEYNIPTASREIALSGDCDSMAVGWNNAVKLSQDTGATVKVILENNWTAKSDTVNKTSFGTGDGFRNGCIFVPLGSRIVLDLAGKTIDRALTSTLKYGRIIDVKGFLDIIDSGYDMSKIYNIYDNLVKSAESNSSLDTWQKRRDYVCAELKKINCGKLTGAQNAPALFGNNDAIGGAIMIDSEGVLNIYGGMIYDNKGDRGIIAVRGRAQLNVYDVLMLDNLSMSDAAGIMNHGITHIYNGLFVGNTALTGIIYSSSAYAVTEGMLYMEGGRCSYNTSQEGGTINAYTGKIYLYYGYIDNNNARGISSNADGSLLYFFDGVITKNLDYGATTYTNGLLKLAGGVITGNLGGGATKIVANGRIVVEKGTQIYGNTKDGKECDVYLSKNHTISIVGIQDNNKCTTRIGITLASNYVANAPFTDGYGLSNSMPPSAFFFSNDKTKSIDFNSLKTEAIVNSTLTELVKVKWKINDKEYAQNRVELPYTGSDYTISALDNKGVLTIGEGGADTSASSVKLRNVGTYAYYIREHSFRTTYPIITVVIKPIEVDITWGTNKLTYNGSNQIISASVAGYPNCVVTVSGAHAQAGTGYMAVASALSDPNLKIKGGRQTKEFSIERAKVALPSGSQTFMLDGNEHFFMPTSGWDNTKMTIVDNKATKAGTHYATILLKDPINHQWATGGSEPIQIGFTIKDMSIIKGDIYDFVYLQKDGDSVTRKNYRDSGVYRLTTDSAVINGNGNKLIMGNIAPNTTVFEFMDNLTVERNQISIYNGDRQIIAQGEVASGVDESLLNNKMEMPIGTGWRVVVTHQNADDEEIYLSVIGDLTGDGKANSADLNVLRKIVNDNSVFDNIKVEARIASLILNKGKLATNSDAQLLWEAICGRLDIRDFI